MVNRHGSATGGVCSFQAGRVPSPVRRAAFVACLLILLCLDSRTPAQAQPAAPVALRLQEEPQEPEAAEPGIANGDVFNVRMQEELQELEAAQAGVEAIAIPLVKKHADWKYWDRGEDPGADWMLTEFDDLPWQGGPAPLGYGDNHIKTAVEYGGDPAAKHLVTFLRHTFKVENPDEAGILMGELLCDDAVAVYLNGEEIHRRNLPEGELTLATRANVAVAGEDERKYWEFRADAKLLRAGDNTLAVRVHQTNSSSTDLGFDLELRWMADDVAALQWRRLAQQIAVIRERLDRRRAQALPAFAPPNRVQFSLVDGEMSGVLADGTTHIQRMDAIQQARSVVPSAKFVRIMQGDSLAKIAAQRGLDVKKLALLNRTVVERVYTTPDIVCVAWSHTVRPNETLEVLASAYNIDPKYLAELNDLDVRQPLESGRQVTVPGEFKYQFRRSGVNYLRLTRYVEDPGRMPINEQSVRLRRERLGGRDELLEFLEKHQVTEEFLRKMNGVEPDEPLAEGRWLLVEYSVELSEDTPADELAQFFNVPTERLLDVNQLAPGENFEAGRRVEIPIGDQMGEAEQTYQVAPVLPEWKVFEVELPADET